MRRDILLIILGLVIGIPIPNLATMANALLGGNRGLFMEMLRIALISFAIEAVIVIVIILLLRREYKRTNQTDTSNTNKITEAIQALGIELGGKIDRLGSTIDGKPKRSKPKQ